MTLFSVAVEYAGQGLSPVPLVNTLSFPTNLRNLTEGHFRVGDYK